MRTSINLACPQTGSAAPFNTDVLIVGAGPVGLLLANLLGAQGIRTLVLDKRDTPLNRSMAIGITPPSLEILKPLGLDRVFSRAGVPVRHAEVHEARARLGRLDFAGISSDYPFFLSLPQAVTVEILRANLAKFTSVAVQSGVEFIGLEQDVTGVNITLRDANSGIAFTARARLLAGCDGPRSRVRAVAGLQVRERVYPQRFVMADFTDHSGLGTEARLFFAPEASVESFPMPDSGRRWIVLANARNEEPPLEYLVRTVRRLTDFDLGDQPARFVCTFGAKRMIVNRYHAGRVVLAGDAAHVMSSIGGQGMNTGFADAEMLARILPAVLQMPQTTSARFNTYDCVRRRAYKVAANRAERGMWLGTLRGKIASSFRKHLIRDLLFRPPLRQRLAPHFAMLTIPFRNLNHVPENLFTTP